MYESARQRTDSKESYFKLFDTYTLWLFIVFALKLFAMLSHKERGTEAMLILEFSLFLKALSSFKS